MEQGLDIEMELAEAVAGFSSDPLGFVQFIFPWGMGELRGEVGPDEWQRDALRAIGEGLSPDRAVQLAVASGNDTGKSAFLAWVIYWAMSTETDCRGVVTANTEAQLRTKTWPELAKWHRMALNKHWFKVTATSMFSTAKMREKNWRVDAIPWTERNSEGFAGLHNKGKRVFVAMDEGSSIPDLIWEFSEPAMMDEKTERLWIVAGNPTRNIGRFKECFGKLRHRWITFQLDSRKCRMANKEKIQEWIDDYGIDSDYVKVHVRGMFPSASSLQFISLEDLDKAYGKNLRPNEYEFAPKILTLDNAWTGVDEGVIGMRQGLAYKILRTFQYNDNDIEVAKMLAECEDAEKADIVNVDGGFGTGVVSCGKTWGRKWQIVWFSEKSSEEGCLNLRAQMWKGIKTWLKEGGALPEDQVLYQELSNMQLVGRTDGILQMESKKDMKKRGLPSPGRADALALTFACPVSANLRKDNSAVIAGKKSVEWSPFDYL